MHSVVKVSLPGSRSLSLAELCVLILLPVGGLAQGMQLSERVVNARAHQSVIETVRRITDAEGQSVLLTNRYVELVTGLNRKDPRTGQWVRQRAEVSSIQRSSHELLPAARDSWRDRSWGEQS